MRLASGTLGWAWECGCKVLSDVFVRFRVMRVALIVRVRIDVGVAIGGLVDPRQVAIDIFFRPVFAFHSLVLSQVDAYFVKPASEFCRIRIHPVRTRGRHLAFGVAAGQ